MNSHVQRYYRKYADEETPIHLFHDVICLHQSRELSKKELLKKVPGLPSGWFELSRLDTEDRIEFVRDFWLGTLPYVPHIHLFFSKFFSNLDDVGVFLTQTRFDSPYECELVYSLKDGTCFFHGAPPCTENQIDYLRHLFENVLPEDYLAFLRIHDGFSKHADTGLIRSKHLEPTHRQLQTALYEEMEMLSSKGKKIDPKDLIPFYESFGMQGFQCFFADWYPEQRIGNIYCSRRERMISDIRNPKAWLDNLAFPTFLDWLIFYLEEVE
jgi:hypothetical protein